jgi:anti-sigma regulatory factor (Ser/Thr protein kinase)
LQERARFPAELASASGARRWAATVLRGWGAEHVVADVGLVVSELVGNAVLHARSAVELSLSRDGSGVIIEASDSSPREPVRRDFGPQAPTGRGLQILDALAPGWHSYRSGSGKTVRAVVPLPVAASGSEA